MTYLQFHLFFLLPPLLLLALGSRRSTAEIHPRAGLFLLAIAFIAVIYTTPWDNYLVWRGVWSYGTERVIGTLGYVPIEEYIFFILQPLLTGLWLLRVMPRRRAAARPSVRWVGAGVYAGLGAVGALLLFTTPGTYLGLILAWAMPVLALQWAYAGEEIWRERTAWGIGVAFPTVYLWVADAIAIRSGIWRIAEVYTLGPALGPLPLEEAVFFLVTNLLVVQGLLLFLKKSSREAAVVVGRRGGGQMIKLHRR